MKKLEQRLSLKKFTVSKLDNLNTIIGGNSIIGDDGGDTAPTVDGDGGKCIQTSKIKIKEDVEL